MGPVAPVRPRGQCGMTMSDMLPNLGSVADELCLLQAMHTDNKAHAPATLQFHTGTLSDVRPSMGSWISYGLGSENRYKNEIGPLILLSYDMPINFIKKPVGVITRKKIILITIGLTIFPKKIPNLNHILLRGVKIFEFINAKIKKIIDTSKDQFLIASPFNNGQKLIIKKTTAKTIPKFRLVGSFISLCIIALVYSITLSFKSKAFINSFHSLFERPESSKLIFSPLISFFTISLPFEETSVPPTL